MWFWILLAVVVCVELGATVGGVMTSKKNSNGESVAASSTPPIVYQSVYDWPVTTTQATFTGETILPFTRTEYSLIVNINAGHDVDIVRRERQARADHVSRAWTALRENRSGGQGNHAITLRKGEPTELVNLQLEWMFYSSLSVISDGI